MSRHPRTAAAAASKYTTTPPSPSPSPSLSSSCFPAPSRGEKSEGEKDMQATSHLLRSCCFFSSITSHSPLRRWDYYSSSWSCDRNKRGTGTTEVIPTGHRRRRCKASRALRPPPRPVVASLSSDPLLVQAARGETVSRPPAWMMRQAGRYMAVYRKVAEKYPSFRERSETVDLIVEISLQPWRAFHPDGVIIFSDILTPLPAFGVPFEIEEVKGPIIQSPIQTEEGLKTLHPIDLDKLHFVGESLRILCEEVGEKAAVLGFVGAPWTIATYIVEGGTTRSYATIKSMCHTAPHILRALLSHLTKAISEYIIYQINTGAQCIQIFDSWGGQLPPNVWDSWSRPYIEEMVAEVKKKHPQTPIVLYISGNGGLLERMKETGVDVIGLDWTVDMADGRRRLGDKISVQGNVDPTYLFSPLPVVTDEIQRVVRCAGRQGHILNLGHGVLVRTPEDAVAHFFDVVKGLNYDTLFERSTSKEVESMAHKQMVG